MASAHNTHEAAGAQLMLNDRVKGCPLADGAKETNSVGSAISLFTGAGGLDLGIEAAGFQTTVAMEWDHDSADTTEKNASAYFPSLREVLREDLNPLGTENGDGITATDILRAGGFSRGETPDLLVGGPPCTPFSKSGFWLEWKRNGQDPAASLLQAFTKLLAQARPRFFLLENVHALSFDNKASRPAFERLKSEICSAGYNYRWRVLNAADFGVPQSRMRLFMVGSRAGERVPELPKETHQREGAPSEAAPGMLAHVTAGYALDGLASVPEPEEIVRGRWGHLLPEIPPGENYLHYTAKRGHPEPIFDWRSRYWSFLLKLSPDRPSPTIQAQPGPNVGPFHWENRRLRVPELRRLFGFPDDYNFVGKRSSVQSQIGNAVPFLLSQSVAKQIAAVA